MIEGILSIQRQEVPAILSRRLEAYLNRKTRTRFTLHPEASSGAEKREAS